MDASHLAAIVPLLFMGLALGMDVFSVSLGLGMQAISFKKMIWIGVVFGAFHMIMPFIGIVFGHMLSREVHLIANLIGGLILVGLGTHMVFSSMRKESSRLIDPMGMGLFIIALTVSLDSFTVGISLGIVGTNAVSVLVFFGVLTMVLAWIGIAIGEKVNRWLGAYSELLGGSILCSFGLYIIFT